MRQIRKRRNRYSARCAARRRSARTRANFGYKVHGFPNDPKAPSPPHPVQFPFPALSARNNIVPPSHGSRVAPRVDLNARENARKNAPYVKRRRRARRRPAIFRSICARKTRRDHRGSQVRGNGSRGDEHEIRFGVRPDNDVAHTVARYLLLSSSSSLLFFPSFSTLFADALLRSFIFIRVREVYLSALH